MDQLIEFNSLLNKSGITLGWLALIALLFTITFVLSTRELLLWYFKSHHLHAQIEEIKDALTRIERQVNGLALSPTTVEPKLENQLLSAASDELTIKNENAKAKPFTLNH